jgi:hypothetical protein
MARKTSLVVTVRIEGVRETLAAYRRLPKEASQALRKRSGELAETLAGRARAAALSDAAPQSPLLAKTVRARRDRVPSIVAGGARRVGRRKVPAWKVLFGSEFGSNTYKQFGRRHSGRVGHWFFPVAERNADDVIAAWRRAADDIARSFSAGPGVR